ncbi:MAG: 3-dehydroquinate synthase [Flavobacteriales bacterium]|nr:3-dehydroquinate synthase [Flavobacteriales bacterium]
MSLVLFKEQGWAWLTELLKTEKAIILCDSNTKVCLEYLHQCCPAAEKLRLIEIPAGEENKKLKTCEKVWYELTEFSADRATVLLNLGGGVVTDLGGFVASTYMRGIRFVNIPTSMLGMVDAAVGGKTGVDFGVLKNMIGTFAQPETVVIDSNFLKTLPKRQYNNGLAEVLKHAFITDTSILDLMYANEDELISRSVNAKMSIVKSDQFEAGERKKLNFGHTIGHAIESHFLSSEKPILHGEAVAAGMIMAAHISGSVRGLSEEDVASICSITDSIFSRIAITNADWTSVKNLLIHDKKNADGKVQFVLLSKLGEAIVDQEVSDEQLGNAYAFYLKKA